MSFTLLIYYHIVYYLKISTCVRVHNIHYLVLVYNIHYNLPMYIGPIHMITLMIARTYVAPNVIKNNTVHLIT